MSAAATLLKGYGVRLEIGDCALITCENLNIDRCYGSQSLRQTVANKLLRLKGYR